MLTIVSVILFCLIGFFGYRFYKDHQSYNFDTPEEADFYILSNHGISSFAYQEGQLQELSNNSFEIVANGLNNANQCPLIQNRYLILNDEYGPSWKTGRFVSVDFEKGKVLTKKTTDASSQTTGSSSEYFFISKYAYNDSYLSVYSSTLEYIDQYKFPRPIFANSFSVDGDQIYMYGLSMADNENASYLYHFNLVNGRLNLVQEKRMDALEYVTHYSNTVLIQDKLVTTIRGGNNVVTGENNVIAPSIVIDHILTGERQTVMSERNDYKQVCALDHNLVAIEYEGSSTPGLMSFTLLNVHDLSSQFVSLQTQPNHDGQVERLQSIRKLDADRIIVLTTKSIWIYNLPAQQFESQHQLPASVQNAFDIWAPAQP